MTEVRKIMASLSVIDGTITVDTPGEDADLATIDGRTVALHGETDPWSEEEESLDRADTLLVSMGWTRVGEWEGDGDGYTATVVHDGGRAVFAEE